MNYLRLMGISLVCAVLGFSSPSDAAARTELATFTQGLQGLEATFQQKVYSGTGQLKESTQGTVAVSLPNLFRWEYTKPYPQLIVADGKKVWVFEPDLQQVTVRPQGQEEQNTPLAALVDIRKLEKNFDISEQAGTENGLSWLTLTPKVGQDASFQVAKLGLSSGVLNQMEIIDAVGQRTVIELQHVKRNPSLAADLFRYTPAAGVDVIGQ